MTPLLPIALSCGEPAGVGPEITVKAWDVLRDTCPFFWIGDPRHLPQGTEFVEISTAAEALNICATALPVLTQRFEGPVIAGQPRLQHAAAVIESIETAVNLVQDGQASAICTAPIHKKALIDGAGFAYPGHTEFLAALAGRNRVVMMLASEQLRVVPATIHIALAEVPQQLTPALLRETITITVQGLQGQFGIAHPRIAVAGLNPHAGEGGAMGQEELTWITALLRDMQSEQYDLTGPHPADTLFHAAARARYDAAICMYHDQGMIPVKMNGMGVNITLGLPILRTSVDHGTAFDIVGQNKASAENLKLALKTAGRLSQSSLSMQ